MREFNFEIYTCDEVTGEGGWDIKFVSVFAEGLPEAKTKLRQYPNFDCIILFNYGALLIEGTEEERAYAKGAKFLERYNYQNNKVMNVIY